jgi:hypothetical protein
MNKEILVTSLAIFFCIDYSYIIYIYHYIKMTGNKKSSHKTFLQLTQRHTLVLTTDTETYPPSYKLTQKHTLVLTTYIVQYKT